ncbi:50S ribosomal protein L31 [candidate division Kazan bacterium RIFCSPHIGHO2_01_FULL_49_10]|uniref:Large ribosomal subunit protein bL31 n=1 Tax=candidate division Kazan bacterium RIFCSPLOWO2_01_FULL_48_13 TaxID=1798539 RepID=A0A1F4PPE0_UNCK3|nr:MAG: 50S ribosomal protein L31 [candidate division Kazan bacterium RIFCSPHIGHO2_01_FULL_49_10]OGB85495.1 MAG: 50S ribosomal protein L31 [candidate division Kazan bacterium RIFCSPLOWO2_01_FULL_48_13]
MKKDIHPAYYPQAKIQCACGNVLEVGSVAENLKVEVCSACHPLYTGKQKLLDRAGRVEKFKARVAKTTAKQTTKKPPKGQAKAGK